MARKNLKVADVRESVIAAGLELLHERGVSTSLGVTLTEAINRSGVPRSSAYVALGGPDGKPLERFHREILGRLDSSEDQTQTLAAVEEVVVEMGPLLESKDPVQWGVVMREIIRRTLAANLAEARSQSNWRIFLALLAALGTRPERDLAENEALRFSAMMDEGEFGDTYLALFTLFGIRLVPGVSIDTFSVATASVTSVMALRVDIDDRLEKIERPSGPNGETELWNMAAVAFEGFILTCTEPDPNAEISADITGWLRY